MWTQGFNVEKPFREKTTGTTDDDHYMRKMRRLQDLELKIYISLFFNTQSLTIYIYVYIYITLLFLDVF